MVVPARHGMILDDHFQAKTDHIDVTGLEVGNLRGGVSNEIKRHIVQAGQRRVPLFVKARHFHTEQQPSAFSLSCRISPVENGIYFCSRSL
jgi:hypothetical protein